MHELADDRNSESMNRVGGELPTLDVFLVGDAWLRQVGFATQLVDLISPLSDNHADPTTSTPCVIGRHVSGRCAIIIGQLARQRRHDQAILQRQRTEFDL